MASAMDLVKFQYMQYMDILDEEEEELSYIPFILSWSKSPRRWWVHPINQRRIQHGAFYSLVPELKLHFDPYKQYLRLDVDQFTDVLRRISPMISKQDTNWRKAVSAEERLTIFLRYLATGESFRSLSFSFRVGVSTVSDVVASVGCAIWDSMVGEYMPVPKSAMEWKTISGRFEELWNFPHCVGAIDGKHVVIQAPDNSGSLFHNYKGSFSIVLMSVVDADYRFITIDVGSYGHNNDAGIFGRSHFGQALSTETLNLPEDATIPDSDTLGPMPYVFVGDDAFPLGVHLMKPYTRANTMDIGKRVFNYRLSRARRIVENAFGILATRFRVFHTKISVSPETAITIVKAACILHNYMRSTTSVQQQQEDEPMDVRNCQAFVGLQAPGRRSLQLPCLIRDKFKEYFLGAGSVSWQMATVRRGLDG